MLTWWIVFKHKKFEFFYILNWGCVHEGRTTLPSFNHISQSDNAHMHIHWHSSNFKFEIFAHESLFCLLWGLPYITLYAMRFTNFPVFGARQLPHRDFENFLTWISENPQWEFSRVSLSKEISSLNSDIVEFYSA